MAELIKFGASKVVYHIRHDLRELPAGKTYGNEAVDTSLSKGNYSLLKDRCQTTGEANKYRKKIEKELYKYNRKNLVHAVEIVVQCPVDCPEEQKDIFFQETYKYICSTLPMGERCVFVAQVHVDERHYSPTGQMISKDHLHVMYIPAVKDTKHEGFEYRLCADQLTKKARLKAFHPGLQKHLEAAGIHATVYRKKSGDGKAVSLSADQLKELTQKTGITLDHTLTVDELADIINANILQTKQIQAFQAELSQKERWIKSIHTQSQEQLARDTASLRQVLAQNEELQAHIKDLRNLLDSKSKALEIARSHEQVLSEKIEHLEAKEKSTESVKKERTWGYESGWGAVSGWGTRTSTADIKEEEKTR